MKTGSLGKRVTLATLALLIVVLTGVIAAVTIAYRSNREQDLATQLRTAADDVGFLPPGDVMKVLVANLARNGIAVDFASGSTTLPAQEKQPPASAPVKPDPASTSADNPADASETRPTAPALATTAKSADGGNPLDDAVQAALDAGSITKVQATALRRQIAAGTIDLQGLVDSGTLTATEMRAMQDWFDAVKQSVAIGTADTAPSSSISTRGSLLVLSEVRTDGTRIILSASKDAIEADVWQLLAIEVAVALVALVLATLLIRRLTAAALRPLAEVSRTATRIAEGDTAERLRPARADTELGGMAAAFDHMVDALEDAARQAKSAEETMRRFLADASHELRTPIAALQATAETLLREQPRRPRRDALETSLAGDAARLGRLVDDLLSLARLDAEQPGATTTVDLASLARAGVAEADRRGSGSDIVLVPGETVWVAGDPEALSRVIRNLIDNAVAAAGRGGHVWLRVAAAVDEARLSVEDDGPGIPAEDRERVFDRFVRLRPGTSSGSGLGLAIARRIARQHRGEVTCDETHHGARFTLRLPLAETADPIEPA